MPASRSDPLTPAPAVWSAGPRVEVALPTSPSRAISAAAVTLFATAPRSSGRATSSPSCSSQATKGPNAIAESFSERLPTLQSWRGWRGRAWRAARQHRRERAGTVLATKCIEELVQEARAPSTEGRSRTSLPFHRQTVWHFAACRALPSTIRPPRRCRRCCNLISTTALTRCHSSCKYALVSLGVGQQRGRRLAKRSHAFDSASATWEIFQQRGLTWIRAGHEEERGRMSDIDAAHNGRRVASTTLCARAAALKLTWPPNPTSADVSFGRDSHSSQSAADARGMTRGKTNNADVARYARR